MNIEQKRSSENAGVAALRSRLIAAKLAKVNDLLAEAQKELSSAVNEMGKDLPDVRLHDARELQNLRTVLQVAVQRPVRATHAHWEGLVIERSRP